MRHEARQQLRAAQRGGERQVPLGRLLRVVDELVALGLGQPAQQRAVLVLPAYPLEEFFEVAAHLLRVERRRSLACGNRSSPGLAKLEQPSLRLENNPIFFPSLQVPTESMSRCRSSIKKRQSPQLFPAIQRIPRTDDIQSLSREHSRVNSLNSRPHTFIVDQEKSGRR